MDFQVAKSKKKKNKQTNKQQQQQKKNSEKALIETNTDNINLVTSILLP